MRPTDHPTTCKVCAGTGWQPTVITNPDLTVDGKPITYSGVEPCTHHWANDPPTSERRFTIQEYRQLLTQQGDHEQLAMLDNPTRWGTP